MRIVIQGALTPKQLGETIQEIVLNTLEKASTEEEKVEGKRYVLHNPVVEVSLNIKGHDKPMLLIEDEKQQMLTVHTGIDKGKLVDYVEVDRTELLEKFNEVTDGLLDRAGKDTEDDVIEGEIVEEK